MDKETHTPQIFIIGATGYIGKPLLFGASKVMRAIGTSSASRKGLLKLNLEDPSGFDFGNIRPGATVMFTAAISAPEVCALEFDRAWAVNVSGTSSLIEGLIDRGARVIFFSSDTVYGERDESFDERVNCKPAGEYAEMKYDVERRFLGNDLFKTIRLSYVFSRDDKFSRYLISCARKNIDAELFHPFSRAVIYRDDVVKAGLALVARWDEVPEQIINFGGPRVLSRIEFAEYIREVRLHNLRMKVTEPGKHFFKKRPRVIAMRSPILSKLLGRPPLSLREAAHIEFAKSSIIGERR